MKRLTILVSVALGLVVATLVGLWGSSGASAGNFEDGLKCYRTQNIQTQQQYHGSLIYISDQFAERNLIVKKPITFCTLADKLDIRNAGIAGAEPTDLLCYDTKDAPGQKRVPLQEIGTADQFAENYLILTKPYSLCESATKNPTRAGAAGDSAPFQDYEFRCYRVRREENGERFQKISVALFDQFDRGGKEVRLGRPIVFCTQVAEKKNKAKNNHIEHAVSVYSSQEYHASTIGATNDHADPRVTCNGEQTAYGHSIWFSYYAPEDTKLEINTEGSTYDTIVAAFDGTPELDGSNQIDCNDDKDYPYSGHSDLSIKIPAYHTVYILVAAFRGDAGGKVKVSFETSDACVLSDLCSSGSTAAASVVDLGDVGDSAGGPEFNLVCYALSQQAPEADDVVTQDQLTLTQFAVGRANMYCTPADKCFVVMHPSGTGTGVIDQKQKCVMD